MNNRKEVLDSIQQTINNCDSKAAHLIAAIGVIFGFSIFSLDHILKTCDVVRILIYVFGSLYLVVFMLVLTLLVLVVFPRNKKRKNKSFDYAFYTEDLYIHLKDENFESFIDKNNDSAIIDQIKECTKIAHIKTMLLRAATTLIVIFGLLLVCLIVLLVF